MALQSPGVEVTVIDESIYTPAEAGTTPLIVIATSQNKTNASGTGIAQGTLKVNAGRVYRVSSQRELVDTFGVPIFRKTVSGSPVHGGEQNEYGLQAAYSYLGVANNVFVVRADVDLAELSPTASVPGSDPINGQWWLDTASSQFGIFEWDQPTQKFVNKIPLVVSDEDQTKVDVDAVPVSTFGKVGDYAVVTTIDSSVRIFNKINATTWVVVGGADWSTFVGNNASFQMSPHTKVPQWKTGGATPAADKSVWIKTSEPNFGAQWIIKRWDSALKSWVQFSAPIFSNGGEAIYSLNRVGGGVGIPLNSLFVLSNSGGAADPEAEFSILYRKFSGVMRSEITITSSTVIKDPEDPAYSVAIYTSQPNRQIDLTDTAAVGNAAGSVSTVEDFRALLNSIPNVSAEYVDGKLVVEHATGGDIYIADAPFLDGITITRNIGSPELVVLSNWGTLAEVGYDARRSAPKTQAVNGQLWYSSLLDEVDLMAHDGTTWVGLNNHPEYTDAAVFVAASRPTLTIEQKADANHIWVSTADSENYPTIYRWNVNSQNWDLIDKTDQTSDQGILFADARWATSGDKSEASAIADLRTSDFLDPDAPDPDLYPQGMLLWNTRRSGFNVKRYVANFIDTTADNPRDDNNPMTDYFAARWVTASANNEDGSGSFGRQAQRKVIIQALKAAIDTNAEIRDEESRNFNLIACPGYVETLSNLVNLNFDRGQTAFVVGDTPFRLKPDTTSLAGWSSNEKKAVDNGDAGLVTRDEYTAVFYPSGFTTDYTGSNIVVPSSHMMLRTIALSDQVSYPWFAPAGTRRGGISNATAVGYIDTLDNEFKTLSLNEGQRNTLYNSSINPITFFNGVGLVNYGQKTLARNASALDRINVARLVVYLRSQLSKLAKPYVFEPNDKITRDEIKQAVESLLLELVGLRALYDFAVVCDETNNTPARIDRNELYVDIAIEPVKAIEFIYIPLRLKNTGEIQGGARS